MQAKIARDYYTKRTCKLKNIEQKIAEIKWFMSPFYTFSRVPREGIETARAVKKIENDTKIKK